MDNKKRLFINIGGILAVSIIGAILTTGLEPRGIGSLKFILYIAFFAEISSPAAFSSRYSCSGMLGCLRK